MAFSLTYKKGSLHQATRTLRLELPYKTVYEDQKFEDLAVLSLVDEKSLKRLARYSETKVIVARIGSGGPRCLLLSHNPEKSGEVLVTPLKSHYEVKNYEGDENALLFVVGEESCFQW